MKIILTEFIVCMITMSYANNIDTVKWAECFEKCIKTASKEYCYEFCIKEQKVNKEKTL